ncbi:hypothetical protein [Pedosphaera parvula]|uniref:Uncharacterized protein n=1 Tax=Pedosphaera parvula (strain Ellin514) TaxID=320771 RepID=B9XRX2_PEDPL|nr:hypothetical protein [Pedosphaera parvula]EEF57431.1 hypothetical protein Cflav_PD0276 [Pedosphaera parvula Ellin514]
MAYIVVPESGEKVVDHIELNLSRKARPFFFAVSNQAIYIPRIKLIAKTDPYYFQRVPLDQLQNVTVRRLRPYALWLLAALMIPIGLMTTIWMMEPLLRNAPGTHRISGWPIAVFVGGFIIPFAAKGRFGLDIRFNGGKYRWKPPLVVDGESKQLVLETFQRIVEACQHVRVQISDERVKS